MRVTPWWLTAWAGRVVRTAAALTRAQGGTADQRAHARRVYGMRMFSRFDERWRRRRRVRPFHAGVPSEEGDGYDFEGRFAVHVSEADFVTRVSRLDGEFGDAGMKGRQRGPFSEPLDGVPLVFPCR
jgi:hypothetical protein